jgi:hypothetical protein
MDENMVLLMDAIIALVFSRCSLVYPFSVSEFGAS